MVDSEFQKARHFQKKANKRKRLARQTRQKRSVVKNITNVHKNVSIIILAFTGLSAQLYCSMTKSTKDNISSNRPGKTAKKKRSHPLNLPLLRIEGHQTSAERERSSGRPAEPLGGPSVRSACAVHAEQLDFTVEGAGANHGRDVGSPGHLVPSLSGLAVAAKHLIRFLLFSYRFIKVTFSVSCGFVPTNLISEVETTYIRSFVHIPLKSDRTYRNRQRGVAIRGSLFSFYF